MRAVVDELERGDGVGAVAEDVPKAEDARGSGVLGVREDRPEGGLVGVDV